MARDAEAGFEEVLRLDPDNQLAVASLASLAYSVAQGIADRDQKHAALDKAKAWYERLAAIEPNNKEAWFSLGVIVWAKFHPALMEARNMAGLKPEDRGPIPVGARSSRASIGRLWRHESRI